MAAAIPTNPCPLTLCCGVFMLLILILLTAGRAECETLPTLTLQPLNYFTLSPPRSPSSPTLLPTLSTNLTAGREKKERKGEEVMLQEEEEEVRKEGDEDKEEEPLPPPPQLASGNSSLRVHLGAAASLDCMVLHPANMSVSWFRRVGDVLELLTYDTHVYAIDNRYSVAAASGSGWRRWRLIISNTKDEDLGQYRCQLATDVPQVLIVTLHVIAPITRVVGDRGGAVKEKHYKSGSRIELTCVIEQVPFPPHPVTWRRGQQILTYNTSRGGISVKVDRDGGFVRTRLYVADATPADSGTYTCCYNVTCAAVLVHVLAGENSAAMQYDALPDTTSQTPAHPTSLSSSSSILFNLSPFLLSLVSTLLTLSPFLLSLVSTFSLFLVSLVSTLCTIWAEGMSAIFSYNSDPEQFGWIQNDMEMEESDTVYH